MARREQDREDLLAEATALVERVGLRLTGQPEPCIVGFRRDGSVSFYFGTDPVYQFTSRGLLRRAFVDGLMYKADGGRIVSLSKQRRANSVDLVRYDLDHEEQVEFLTAAERRTCELVDLLSDVNVQVVGQSPADVDVLGRVRRWLTNFAGPIAVADAPRSA